MSKDGTSRGGMRVGAGKKRKSLEEKILEGKATAAENTREKTAKAKMKPPKKYLSAEQKMGGGKTHARQIYRDTWDWIAERGCTNFVTQQLVESYAQMAARHIQCEELLSSYGMIGKHPTTGEAIASPFVKMSMDYLRQASQLWYQIYMAVRDNATQGIVGTNQDDVMESLLRRVK